MDVTGRALRLWFAGARHDGAGRGGVRLGVLVDRLASPLALATIAAVTNFVPFLGPILGAIPALLFAFAMDLQTMLWTLGAVVAIQQIEGNVITPVIQKRAVAMPPVVVLFAIGVFGFLFGLLGIFLAVPLAVAITVLVKKLWVRQTLGEETNVPGEEAPTDDVVQRQHEPAHTHQCDERREAISSQIRGARSRADASCIDPAAAGLSHGPGDRHGAYALKALRGRRRAIWHQSASPFT